MAVVLAFDPGISTGWAMIEVLDRKITPLGCGVMKPFDTLAIQELVKQCDIVVTENFRPRKKESDRGAFIQREMTTSEYIGKIETIAELEGKRNVRQEPSTKPAGYGWSNQKYVAGKQGQHFQDALAHAVYYAVQKLGALPVRPSTPGKNADSHQTLPKSH